MNNEQGPFSFKTGDEAIEAQHAHDAELYNAAAAKEIQQQTEKQDRFDNIEIGAAVSFRDIEGLKQGYIVTKKNEEDLTVDVMDALNSVTSYGTTISIDAIVDHLVEKK